MGFAEDLRSCHQIPEWSRIHQVLVVPSPSTEYNLILVQNMQQGKKKKISYHIWLYYFCSNIDIQMIRNVNELQIIRKIRHVSDKKNFMVYLKLQFLKIS